MVYENEPLKFISFPTINSSEINNLLCDYGGFKAFGIITALYCYIGRTGCYYTHWNRSAKLDFLHTYYCDMSRDKGVNYVDEIVKYCLRTNIFDKEKFEKYNILTNEYIQRAFLVPAKRRLKVFVNKDYVLNFLQPDFDKLGKNANISSENVNISEQREGKESERKEKETKNIIKEGKEEKTTELPPPIIKFKNEFPDKIISSNENEFKVPASVDIDLLIKKIKDSTFIQRANNFTLEYMCKDKVYKKITSGYYDNDGPVVKEESSPKKIKQNFEQRTYNKEKLDSLYDDIDDINI